MQLFQESRITLVCVFTSGAVIRLVTGCNHSAIMLATEANHQAHQESNPPAVRSSSGPGWDPMSCRHRCQNIPALLCKHRSSRSGTSWGKWQSASHADRRVGLRFFFPDSFPNTRREIKGNTDRSRALPGGASKFKPHCCSPAFCCLTAETFTGSTVPRWRSIWKPTFCRCVCKKIYIYAWKVNRKASGNAELTPTVCGPNDSDFSQTVATTFHLRQVMC